MATTAVGDIHGHLAPLLDLLRQLRPELGEGDTLVFLGDYIDRGPDSRRCVDAILQFREETRADVVCLLGNHEDWMLRTEKDYTSHSWLLGMAPMDTIRSYSPEAEQSLSAARQDAGLQLYTSRCRLPYDVFFDAMPPAHRQFFAQLALSVETVDCICTHAGVDPAVARLAEQSREALVWGTGAFPAGYDGGPVVVYGHRNNAVLDDAGWPSPRVSGNTVGIDTISHGVLTAFRLPDRRVFQSARLAPRRWEAD